MSRLVLPLYIAELPDGFYKRDLIRHWIKEKRKEKKSGND